VVKKEKKHMADTSNATHELDNLFAAYAKKAEDDAKNTSHGTFTPREYEDIKYTGLVQGVPSVLRIVGGPVDSGVDPYTARTVNICRIVGDDGNKFRVIRPSAQDDPNYIINKIISTVTKPAWVNKEKTFPIKDKFPEIYNIIEKNGLQKGDPQYNYEKGWKGKEVFIMNVIDREQMDWHKQNNHTMLLAKSVNPGKNGGEFVDEGISAFACNSQFAKLYKRYGSWEKYDISITKTGDKSKAFDIENATRSPESAEDKESFVSNNPCLTDEEKSWEKYDLDKLFRITTATKIYNRLKQTIARIDVALNTHFLDELKEEVEKEKVKFEELYGNKTEASGNTSSDEPEKETATETPDESIRSQATQPSTRTRARVSTSGTKPVWSILPFADTMADSIKGKIKSVTKGEGDFFDIVWDYPEENLAECPVCHTVAPLECDTCPACGESFVG
jgi:hypothetical protein